MFSRVIPSWEQIRQFKQPLTEGELYLLKFLDENLEKDALFQGNDLTQYKGWLIFVQPFLNGSRPDIVILNPRVGVQIFEVKDWHLDNYSFEETRGNGNKSYRAFCVSDGKGTYEIKSPIKQIEYYNDQKKFAEPQSGHFRVRGVAGSGKTQVLAYRASKLASQGYRVLVLTYNLTLWHFIRDMVQRSPFDFSWRELTITYFHGFCKDILNQFGEKWPKDNDDEEALFREIVPKKVLDTINGEEYVKYDAILIDEGQDFHVEWYSMLCHFLTNRDEVVVVCDKKQNIYGTRTEWLDRRHREVKKFGDWIELKKIIRLPEQVAKISLEFSKQFNLNKDISVVYIERQELFNQFQDQVLWWNIEDDWLIEVDKAFEIIKSQAVHKHPSDTAILLPDKRFGFRCVSYFELKKKVLVNHVFENYDDKRNHRYKKAFWMGDSRLKMSTIHSFKGWEVPNIIVVIPSDILGDEQLYDSLVYTAITRPKENLIVINANKRYREFGENISDEWR